MTTLSIRNSLSQFYSRRANIFLASNKHVSHDNLVDGVFDASTNLKYWLDLFESKGPTNSSPEVQQFTTYIGCPGNFEHLGVFNRKSSVKCEG